VLVAEAESSMRPKDETDCGTCSPTDPSEDEAFVKQTIERASQDGKDFDFKYRLLMPKGAVKHVRIVGHAESDKSGEHKFVGA
jgi:hypothetical protein